MSRYAHGMMLESIRRHFCSRMSSCYPLLIFPEPERQLKANIYPGRPVQLLGIDIKDILRKITLKIAHEHPPHSGMPCQYWAGISIP